jgi:hypothetical protein
MIPYSQIKTHYEYLTPIIIERSMVMARAWACPYSHIDWMRIFSPIENQAWQAIRGVGSAPMYPQYPVDKYFMDFGNPYVKVAIECDGKAYHRDREKDKKRDERLLELGWTVYRVPGSDCVRPVNWRYYDLDYIEECRRGDVLMEFYMTTIEGVIRAISIKHFGYDRIYDNRYVNERRISEYCIDKYHSIFQKIKIYEKGKIAKSIK